jgi:hypothetical protein
LADLRAAPNVPALRQWLAAHAELAGERLDQAVTACERECIMSFEDLSAVCDAGELDFLPKLLKLKVHAAFDALPKKEAILDLVDDDMLKVNYNNWVNGALVACLAVPLPLGIGLARDGVGDVDIRSDGYLWMAVWGPAIALMCAQLLLASILAPKVGFDMIQERSEEVSIPDSMRSNLTNQGLVAALFLTIVMFMVQAAPPQVDKEGGNATLLAQWYEALLILATGQMGMGIVIASICLICALAAPPPVPRRPPSHLTPRAQTSSRSTRRRRSASSTTT